MPKMYPKTFTHKCAARRCPIYVVRSMLLCTDHWQIVPPTLKQTLNEAFSDRNRDPTSPVTQAYADAMVAIINYIDRLEAAQARAGVALDMETLMFHPDDPAGHARAADTDDLQSDLDDTYTRIRS